MTRKKIIGGIVLGAALLSLVAAALLVKGSNLPGDDIYTGNRNVVGIININGAIMVGETSTGFLGGGYSGSQTIMRQLRQVSKSPNVKAVVLRMNSPGGTTAGSQEITEEVARLKRSGVKIVTSMGDMAASGAYWIASSSDWIVANPGTITGSIGVIMQTSDYQGLYEKLGIGGHTFKSGQYKDMGSPQRPLTEEEMKIFQSMVDDSYQQFVDVVANGRKLKPEAVRALNGRVLTGRQAMKAGLVDQMGNYYDAVSKAGELAGLGKNPGTVDLETKKDLFRFLEELSSSSVKESLPLNLLREHPWALLMLDPAGM